LLKSAEKSTPNLSAVLVFQEKSPDGVVGYYGEPGNQTVLPATKCIQRDLDHVEVRSGALVVEEAT